MTFDLIAPEQIRAVWPRVKAGLERVLQVCTETWIAEDIFAHLRTKLANLYVCHEGNTYLGFFIIEANKRDPFTNELFMNVWIVYAEPQNGGEHFADVARLVEDSIGFLDGLAQKAGIKVIRMSGRRGWERFLSGVFQPIRVCYERTLPT
jgi:hypothetical protein